MTRRDFLKLSLAGAGAAFGWGAYHLGWERFDIRLVRRRLAVPGLPPELEGIKVAHLSDFHAGRYTPWALTEKAVSLATQARADIVFLTGDYVSLPRGQGHEELALNFQALSAPYGVWAVLGNHDCIFDRHAPVSAGLADARVTVLNNASACVEIRGREVWIVGVDDPVTGHADFEKAMAGVPSDATKILLAHTPDAVDSASALGFNALFAGHTHGGQVVIPFLGPPLVPCKYGKRFASGAIRFRDTAVHVTRGVGMVPPLVRFCCPPEVALVTLVPA
ncbi:MAG: metallophosphoesterase [Armatimonadetes bacterium]|nr:metallophosphoesterase [Armatimonadota bacterium]